MDFTERSDLIISAIFLCNFLKQILYQLDFELANVNGFEIAEIIDKCSLEGNVRQHNV